MNPLYKLKDNEWIIVPSRNKYKHVYTTQRTEKKYKYDNEQVNKTDNLKKIICKNIINNGVCMYGQKCLYAHTLDDQNIDAIRKTAYDIIKGNGSLKNINLANNKQLYETLKSLSKMCEQCENNSCTGGYNCKHGACKKEYVICLTDMNKGTCNKKCEQIHLTERGLQPYGVCIARKKENILVQSVVESSDDDLDNQFKYILRMSTQATKNEKKTEKVAGQNCQSIFGVILEEWE